MKNLFVTTALMIALLGSSSVFAGEMELTDARLSAFENVQSVSASDEELKVVGEGIIPKISTATALKQSVLGTVDIYNIGKSYACALSGKSGCTLPTTYYSTALKTAQKVGIIR